MPINLHLLMPRAGGVVLVVVEERLGLGNVDVVVELQMAQRRHPAAVRRLVLHHEHEGLVVGPLFLQPIHREIGHHIRRVTINAHLAFGCEEIRIVVQPLPRQHHPVIKPLRITLQMALAVNGRLIARFLQQLRENLLVPVKSVAVIHEPVLVTVLATHDHRAARPANGVGTKTFLEHHAILGQLVDFWRGIDRLQPAVVRANGVRSVVVTEHKQNVRALILGGNIQRQQ